MCLTPFWYHFAMQTDRQTRLQFRTGKKAGIWLSLVFALALHLMFLLVPIVRQIPPAEDLTNTIEVQLTTVAPPPLPDQSAPEPELEPEDEPLVEPVDEKVTVVLEETAAPEPIANETPPVTTNLVARKLRPNLDAMSEPEKRQLTTSLLARQYFTEESAADQLFGKPLPQQNADIRKEFHYPVKPNMMTMLEKPIPEMPFAYTPDLVYFAYDPGVKGDLQRFWDDITPEFGWRTKYGTEVRCILILVIVGCGWK